MKPMVAAHKGKALVLRWLGARQRLYLERRIRMESTLICSFSESLLKFNNIRLELSYENNDWYIDNFIDPRSKYNERKEILKSFKLMGVK